MDPKKIDHDSYEIGYREGGNSRDQDWLLILGEYEFPDADIGPTDTPQIVAKKLRQYFTESG